MIKKEDHALKNKWNKRRKAAIDRFIIKAATSNQNYSPLTDAQNGVETINLNIDDTKNEKAFSRKILGDVKHNSINHTSSNDIPDKQTHVGKNNYDGIALKVSRSNNQSIKGKENSIDAPNRKLNKDCYKRNMFCNYKKDSSDHMETLLKKMSISPVGAK